MIFCKPLTFHFVDELCHAHHLAMVVLDGEAEHAPGVEASVLVNLLEELWVLVCVLDVDKLARLSHQAGYPLTHFDPDGLLYK